MHYFIEAIIVGIYVELLYIILHFTKTPFYIELLVVGFIKHFFSYFLLIQNGYCKRGSACEATHSKEDRENNTQFIRSIEKDTGLTFLLESIGESVAFLLLGLFINSVIKNKYATLFCIGVFLHVSSELSGFHKKFCLHQCNRL